MTDANKCKIALIEDKKQQIKKILADEEITFGMAKTIIQSVEAELLENGNRYLRNSPLLYIYPTEKDARDSSRCRIESCKTTDNRDSGIKIIFSPIEIVNDEEACNECKERLIEYARGLFADFFSKRNSKGHPSNVDHPSLMDQAVTLGSGKITFQDARKQGDGKDYLYGMVKNPETGVLEIFPMNGDTITIHGEKEAMFFIQRLIECLQ